MPKQDKILIAGSSGQLAKEFVRTLSAKKYPFAAPSEAQMDITNFKQVEDVIRKEKPSILINCAAFNHVDQAEVDFQSAYRANQLAVEHMARICLQEGIFFVHFSSDYVFDGNKTSAYTEYDIPRPLNIYGLSKLKGELAIKSVLTHYLIFRLSWVFGEGKSNFLYKLDEWSKNEGALKIALDEVSVPTYTEDVVKVVLLALEKNLTGIFHLTNSGQCSRYEWAKLYFEKKSEKITLQPVSMSTFRLKAKRPQYSAMSNSKICEALGITIPDWKDALGRYVSRQEGTPLPSAPVPSATEALGTAVPGLVSVIIPTYNNFHYLSQTIDSVLAQTYKNIELIIVDDGSTDKTLEILESYMERIKYLYKQNGGPASARNLGIKNAKGEFIAFLDGDDLSLPDRIIKEVKFLEAHPNVAMVHCKTSIVDEMGNPKPSTPKSAIPAGQVFMQLFEKNFIALSTVMARKSCLDAVGVFDEDRDLISVEDYDLWLRISSHNLIEYLDEPLVEYRIHTHGISRNIAQSYAGEAKVIAKNVELFAKDFYKIRFQKPVRLSNLFFECGFEYFYIKQYAQAHPQFKRSFSTFPLNLKAGLYYIFTSFPPGLIDFIRNLKRSFKKTSLK